MTSPSCNVVNNFNPLVSWLLQVEFSFGLINLSSSLSNTLIEGEFRIFISRSFHLIITTGKKESLKNYA